MKRLIKRFIAVLTLAILVGVSGLAIVTRLQNGRLLSVQSGSMVPVLSKGDLVSVKRVPAVELRSGDIITFINPLNKQETITHRIVQVLGSGGIIQFATKGDANASTDGLVDSSQVVGKVSYSVPYVGSGADFIRKPLGLVLIIYIPALGIIISELKRLAKYYKSQQPYIAVGRKGKLGDYDTGSVPVLKALPLILLVPLFFTVKAYAALQSTAALTGNTISSTVIPPSNACANIGNDTSATVNISGGSSGNNNNNVNVSNSNNQNAQSGNASNNNTNGGSATSGNASNCNSTNININIGN